MKKISIFATALLLAWGCVNDFDENIAPEGTAKGAFNVIASADNDNRTAYSEVDGVLTASWKAADEIDIISMVDGGEAPYEKLTYTADAAGTKVAFSPKTDALTLKEGGQNYKFYAYYHYFKNEADTKFTYENGIPYLTCCSNGKSGSWNIQPAVDKNGITRLSDYDLLWATPVEVANPSGNVDLNFQFNHAFAVLELKLNTTGSEDITLKQIQVDAAGIAGNAVKVNLADGSLTLGGLQNYLKMNFQVVPTLKANGANTYSCYMTILPGHAGKKFTITVTDQNSKTYTFEKTPSKDILAGQKAVLPLDVNPKPEAPTVNRVEKGVASTTPTLVWSKKLNEIEGVLDHLNVNGLAVSGDYLLLSENGNSNPVYLDALTGEKKGTMDVSAITALRSAYYATNDDGGYIWFSGDMNYKNDNGGSTTATPEWVIFTADDVTSTPTQLKTSAVAAKARVGKKISVVGSKATTAMLVSPYYIGADYSRKYVLRYQWANSTFSRVDDFTNTGADTHPNEYNYYALYDDAISLGAEKTSDIILSSWKSQSSVVTSKLWWSTIAAGAPRHVGTLKTSMDVKYTDSKGLAQSNGLDYIEFNNAKYLAFNTVNTTTAKWGADATFLMDITDGTLTPIPATMPLATLNYISKNYLHGSVHVNNKLQNTNRFADVQLHASADGNYLYAYVMFAGGEVACYRYTCLAE